MTEDMVESAWVNMGCFLHYLNPYIQKEKTGTFKHEDHKKKKYLMVYNKAYLNIYATDFYHLLKYY